MRESDEMAQQSITFTMKILFGPMFGCELHLPADDYFLIISPPASFKDSATPCCAAEEHAIHYMQKTLYLPCNSYSCNILMCLSEAIEEQCQHSRYSVKVQNVIDGGPTLVAENEIFNYRDVYFAIKRSDTQWSGKVVNFNLAQKYNKSHRPEDVGRKKQRTLIAGSFILFILIISSVVVWYKKGDQDQQVFSVNELLAGSPAPLEVVRGRDNHRIYVLATNFREFEWAQQAIYNRHENSSVTPVWLAQHKKDFIAQMKKADYPVVQIDYTRPQYPLITLYQSVTNQQEKLFKSAIFDSIPFAQGFTTCVKSKKQLLQDARQGLDRLHIYYRQIDTMTGYSLVVRDDISDSTLTDLKRFIVNFNQQWGNSIINFSINLNENWLQNKSYLDSSNGYLFLNPRHWYFNYKEGVTDRA